MKTYSDYRSKAGIWYTFRPLNVLKREELASRFNSFDKSMTIAEQLVVDELGGVVHNLKQILKLYDLDICEFEFEEFDELLVEHLLKVNYSELKYDELSIESEKAASKKEDYGDILTNLISSTWGITESAGDAMYLIEKLPAELLIEVIKKRSEVLEKVYSTDEDKRKKQTKDIKETLKEQVKQRMLEMQKQQQKQQK